MTFGIQGFPSQVVAKNVTINNDSGNSFWGSFAGGFAGSIFGSTSGSNKSAASAALGVATAATGMYPQMGMGMPGMLGMGAGMGMYPTMGMTGMYPSLGMSTMGMGMGMGMYPTIPTLGGFNTAGATTATANTAKQADPNMKNLNTLFPKCTIVSEGNGQYTAKTESGKIIQGSYEEVRDGLGKELAGSKTEVAKKDKSTDATPKANASDAADDLFAGGTFTKKSDKA